MSLVDEVRKRVQRITKEPILPILRTERQEKVQEVREKPPEVPPEWWVAYTPPQKRARS